MTEKVKYGEVDVPGDIVERKHQKVRISIMLDGDVLDAAKAAVAETAEGYQTLINRVLREKFFGKPHSSIGELKRSDQLSSSEVDFVRALANNLTLDDFLAFVRKILAASTKRAGKGLDTANSWRDLIVEHAPRAGTKKSREHSHAKRKTAR